VLAQYKQGLQVQPGKEMQAATVAIPIHLTGRVVVVVAQEQQEQLVLVLVMLLPQALVVQVYPLAYLVLLHIMQVAAAVVATDYLVAAAQVVQVAVAQELLAALVIPVHQIQAAAVEAVKVVLHLAEPEARVS
jgi:hypothetical protein